MSATVHYSTPFDLLVDDEPCTPHGRRGYCQACVDMSFDIEIVPADPAKRSRFALRCTRCDVSRSRGLALGKPRFWFGCPQCGGQMTAAGSRVQMVDTGEYGVIVRQDHDKPAWLVRPALGKGETWFEGRELRGLEHG